MLGSISEDIGRSGSNANAGGEQELGDLIADAQLADPSVVTGGQTPVIAFMNPGGIRADLTYAQSKNEGDGVVTYEEAFTVQPFNNYLVSLTMTGAQIKTLLDPAVDWRQRRLAEDPAGVQGLRLHLQRHHPRQRHPERRPARGHHVVPDRDEQLPRRRR